MKNYNYYKTFTTGLIDGILIREDKKIPDTQAEYYDQGRGVGDQKWYQQTALRRMLNKPAELESHTEVRDGTMTNGKVIKYNIDACVYDYLCKLELKPSFGNELDYSYEFAPPFTDTINKLLLLTKWISGIQSITEKTLIQIGKDEIEELDLNMTPLDLHKAIKATFKDSVFSMNRYNSDEKYVVLSIGGRDRKVTEGPGYVKLKTPQYIQLLNNIMEYHDRLIIERSKPKTDI